MPRPLRVLIAEDRPTDAELIVRELRRAGFCPEWQRVDTEAEYISRLGTDLEVVLSDFEMPQFSGLRALQLLRERGLDVPFIIVSGTIGEDMAVAVMKEGATDYLLKDRLTRLGPAIERALEQGKLRRERKQAEEVLRESERRFREMLENLELIAMTLDKEGTITFCNDYLLEVTGWRRAEVIGADWFAKFVPDNQEVKQLFLDTVAVGRIQAHYENPIKTREGRLRDIVWNNTVLRNAGGNVIGTASIGEDVTERKRAEEIIREQAAMLHQAHDAIVVCDIHTRKITFWNQGAERLYGWTAAEAEGRDIGELIFADPNVPDIVTDKLLNAGEWQGELRHLSKAGKELTISSRATLVRDAKENAKSVLAINIDTTELKRLEEQLLRTQRLEGIGTLASGVAHDLNNILAPILMSMPLLSEALAGTPFEALVSTIEQCAARGASIVKQVLTFGRGIEGERVVVQVNHLLREMEKIASETFPRSITIRNNAPRNLWPVIGDATQLHQVLLNLCVNARDAMSMGGTLTMTAENVQIDENYAAMRTEAKPGPYLMIAISDTGDGIPAENLQKIFDPFFTTKEVGKGTGLGLSTTIGIVKSHGGFLCVDSQTGEGATFNVFLPAEPEAEAVSQAARSVKPPVGSGELILVVDDESSIRSIAQAVLQAHGYRVLLAADGTEALAIFAQQSRGIAAVVTDIAMPFMDGAVLARALRRMKPDLRVIVSTGHSEKRQISEVQVNAFLNKPYSADTLLRTLHSALACPATAIPPKGDLSLLAYDYESSGVIAPGERT